MNVQVHDHEGRRVVRENKSDPAKDKSQFLRSQRRRLAFRGIDQREFGGGANLFATKALGADLSFADLGDADGSFAYFDRAKFFVANLADADLRGADITGAIFNNIICRTEASGPINATVVLAERTPPKF